MEARHQLPEAHRRALQTLIELAPPAKVLWVLTGSVGLRLRGVDVQVHDLDVQSTPAGVDEIARRLAGSMQVVPAWRESPQIRSHYGVAELCGVKIELMGDIQRALPDGSWSPVIALAANRHWMNWQNLQVPVLDLAYEAQAYEELGRSEKAALIRVIVQEQGKTV